MNVRAVKQPSYEKVADALAHIPNDVDRPTYINIGYAVYEALGESGWSLFNDWAKQYSDYHKNHTISDWRSFRKGRSITVRTLFWHARRGWKSKDRSSSSSSNGKSKHRDPHVGAQAIPEPPRPLIRELPPADPYPVDALGDILGAAAKGIHDRVQSPIAICAQSVLAAATLAVQGFADIELPGIRRKPTSGFFISVAATGERKTSTDGEALWPFEKREKALREQFNIDLPRFKNAMIAWEKARDHAVKEAKGDGVAIRAALEKLGPEPDAPLTPMLTCTEPTYEGLCKLLASGHPSLGIFSSEGGQFIGGHGMTDEAMLRTATGLSGLWDGIPIKRVRAVDGSSVLPGRRVSLHLMCQPDVAAVMLSDPLLLNQGLLSRCLVTAPASTAGSRMWHESTEASDVAIKKYGRIILDILERPMPLVVGKPNELAPPVMKLSVKASKVWVCFQNDIEAKIKPDGDLAPISGLACKLPEHAGRIAAVLALIADITACEISEDHMSAGIVLAQHYALEALRMFEGSRINADLLLAQKLLNWLVTRNEPLISLRDIYQNGPNAIRDKATAIKMVDILQSHDWLLPIAGGAEIEGRHRRDVWRLIKGE